MKPSTLTKAPDPQEKSDMTPGIDMNSDENSLESNMKSDDSVYYQYAVAGEHSDPRGDASFDNPDMNPSVDMKRNDPKICLWITQRAGYG